MAMRNCFTLLKLWRRFALWECFLLINFCWLFMENLDVYVEASKMMDPHNSDYGDPQLPIWRSMKDINLWRSINKLWICMKELWDPWELAKGITRAGEVDLHIFEGPPTRVPKCVSVYGHGTARASSAQIPHPARGFLVCTLCRQDRCLMRTRAVVVPAV